MSLLSPDDTARLWSKVEKTDGCWLWTAGRTGDGYGRFWIPSVGETAAHRAAWLATGNEIPPGLFVLHRCDNPPCVNPAHLFVGTNTDNMRDMKRKGRGSSRVGERHHLAKLNEEKVIAIRALRASGLLLRELAGRFNVKQRTIKAVCSGQTWSHVERGQ